MKHVAIGTVVLALTIVVAGCGRSAESQSQPTVVTVHPLARMTAVPAVLASKQLDLSCPALAATATASDSANAVAWTTGIQVVMRILHQSVVEATAGQRAAEAKDFVFAASDMSDANSDARNATAALRSLHAPLSYVSVKRRLTPLAAALAGVTQAGADGAKSADLVQVVSAATNARGDGQSAQIVARQFAGAGGVAASNVAGLARCTSTRLVKSANAATATVVAKRRAAATATAVARERATATAAAVVRQRMKLVRAATAVVQLAKTAVARAHIRPITNLQQAKRYRVSSDLNRLPSRAALQYANTLQQLVLSPFLSASTNLSIADQYVAVDTGPVTGGLIYRAKANLHIVQRALQMRPAPTSYLRGVRRSLLRADTGLYRVAWDLHLAHRALVHSNRTGALAEAKLANKQLRKTYAVMANGLEHLFYGRLYLIKYQG